jgi:EAL domain-containing protein (putative c-di-GMP-specific phosphodiesterase class I)/CheY-like chemotaxis protein
MTHARQRILVVDDGVEIRHIAARVLGHLGHEVVTAADGIEALALAAEQDFQVAIVDYEMPGPNGIEVLRRLRDLRPHCVRLLASGALDVDVLVAAVNSGEVARLVRKPFDGKGLASAVDEALEMRRRQGEHYVSSLAAGFAAESTALEQCFRPDVLRIALQPIFTAERRLDAYECLLRSSHPQLRGPLDVIDAADRQGVLPRLCAQLSALSAAWLPHVHPAARLFVNVPPSMLADPDHLHDMLRPLVPHARRVVIEITERSKLVGDSWFASTMRLKSLGFSLAVDDLGAGYSSLAVLAELEPEIIKVDMSIVRDIDRRPAKRRLMELVGRFAQSTGAELVAEGIETEAEAETVVACGATLLQGFLLGLPVLELDGV